jgi:hypothetical protein
MKNKYGWHKVQKYCKKPDTVEWVGTVLGEHAIGEKGGFSWVDAEPNKDPYMNYHTAQSAMWELESRDGMKNDDWEVVE